MAIDIEKVRKQFPALSQKVNGKDLIYFDNAASTLKAKPVINALDQHYQKDTANVHRGLHFLSEKGTRQFEETREAVQKFIGSEHSHEIIFTKGTTESINLVAQCFGDAFLQEGDEILLSTLEHHSNIVPWQIIAQKKGAIVKEIPINEEGEILLEEYKKLLNNKTKVVSISHTSNALGTINPIEEMIPMAHKVGSIFMVDAAQAVAHNSLNVKELNCDFLAFSSHKIFGPTGVGVLYGKEELLNKMPPYQGGGEMIDKVSFKKTTFNELPFKFEAGTPHIAGVIALKSALDYVQEVGLENIANYEQELLEYATEKLQKIEGLKIVGTSKRKASVL
ncbi:MAG: cysteine desulfurase, partial [Bdellovibrionota bacterium]|nr:cysteine desulfurase [Bdellovibrionota bacterium]